MRKQMLMMFAALAAILVVSGLRAQAQETYGPRLYDPNEPGSVLVFPKFVRGTVAAGVPTTEIEITAHCPIALNVDGFCTAPVPGTNIRLAGTWVCPGQFSTSICKENDFIVTTTIEGTISFNTEGSPAGTNFATVRVPSAPCPEGYLVMWAVDNTNRPIKWDGLVGVAEVRWNKGAAASYRAISIQGDPALANNAPMSVGPGGTLPFDGLPGHYAAVTGTVMATVKYDTTTVAVDAPVTTSITLLTLDVLSNLPNDMVFSDLNFFDNNEYLVSEEVNYTCWTETPISSIDPSLTRDFMSRKGFFYSVDAFKVPEYGVSDNPGPVTELGLIDVVECPGSSASCVPTSPVTSGSNAAITNHYIYRTDDDSVPVGTTLAP